MKLDIHKGLSAKELASPIGSFMVPVATAFHEELTVEEVLVTLRKRTIEHLIRYFYTVDDERKLTGIISTRDLLLADPSTKLGDLVDTHVLKILDSETLEHGLRLLEKHGIQAIPIVDHHGHLKGLFELVPEGHAEMHDPNRLIKSITSKDIYQLIGQSLHHVSFSSPRLEYRYRMPWLLCNILAGLICATIGALFAPVLSKYVVIAMFIPLVLSLGESIAMQSMAITMQLLHFGKIRWRRYVKRIVLEWETAILLGLTSAFIVGSSFWVWNTTVHSMLAVTISIFFAMVFSSTLGSLFPVILHSLNLDPKVAAGPVILMLTDVLTTATYLAFASWLLI